MTSNPTNIKAIVLVVAMVCLTIYGSVLTLAGRNGQVALTVVGGLITIAGYLFRVKDSE